MSFPISDCEIYKAAHKAAKGDYEARNELVLRLRENMRLGHFSRFGCQHDPPCHGGLAPEQYESFVQGVWAEVLQE